MSRTGAVCERCGWTNCTCQIKDWWRLILLAFVMGSLLGSCVTTAYWRGSDSLPNTHPANEGKSFDSERSKERTR